MSDSQIRELHKRMDDMNEVLTATRVNVDWLLRFFWIIATSSVGALITGLITLLNR